MCLVRLSSGDLRMWFTATSLKFSKLVGDGSFIMKSQSSMHYNSPVLDGQTRTFCIASSFVLWFQTMLMWAGPEIASCRSWRLCVMWCVRLMICRGECQVLQMWCYLGRSCGGSVRLDDLTLFLYTSCLCLIILCMLSRTARQNLALLSSFVAFFSVWTLMD